MRIGVIGLGSIGKRHVANLLELGHEVMGFDERITTEAWTAKGIGLLYNWKPEAVVICTPPASHAALAIEAMHHGCHCFIEKPIVHRGLESATVLAVAKSKGLHLAVGYQLRWQLDSVGFHADKDIVWECSQNMAEWPSQYQKDVLGEFSHEIDAAVFVNGPVEKLTARESVYGWVIQMRHLSCVSTILINPRATSYSRTASIGSQDIWTFSTDENDLAYKRELQAFLNVCQGQPWDERLCSGAEATHTVRIIEACRESMRECKVMAL